MIIDIALTNSVIELQALMQVPGPDCGAFVLFTGHVRDRENDAQIEGLVYEAYAGMAEKEMQRLALEIAELHPVKRVVVRHRIGRIPVGETAIAISVTGAHRAHPMTFVQLFMDRLKQDVPIWKASTIPVSDHAPAIH